MAGAGYEQFTYEGPSFRLSKTPARLRRRSPKLGQHSDYVLSEILGLPDEEYAELVASGVID